jgi:uncharacterized membrane protein
MEILIVIALIFIFFILLNIQGSLRSNADKVKKDLSVLNYQVQDLKNQLSGLTVNAHTNVQDEKAEKEAAELRAKEEYRQKLAAIEEMRRLREERHLEEQEKTLPAIPVVTVEVKEPIEAPGKRVKNIPSLQNESWGQKWVKNNPDLEKFIGENLVSKIGIAILVLAIGFFVKYAIDKNWIGPIARVSIGILCGGVLVVLAHRLRNTYKSFSPVLAGGGLAILYFTITLAFQQFHLFSQTVAFVIMIGITAFAVALSLLYKKQELAIIALVGGFIAPFLVSTGNDDYKTLFLYLILLNSGLLVIAYHKAWRLLNILNFIFTVILFGSWLYLLAYDEPPVTFGNGFLFATVFYLLFFIINIAHNIKEKKKFISSDFGILLANTCFYFSVGIYCITQMHAAAYKGLFSAAMGIFNLGVTYFLFRKHKADTNIIYLLIGITLTFISITAPLQLHGHFITMFWASEAVLLYWLFSRSALRIVQLAATLVWGLMMISLLMDWFQVYGYSNSPVNIIFNKGFITAVFAAIATYLLYVLRSNEMHNDVAVIAAYVPDKNVFRLAAILLLFAAGILEINFQFSNYYPNTNIHILYLLLYIVAFISMLILITQKFKPILLPWKTIAVLLASSIVLYLVFLPRTSIVQNNLLVQNINRPHFWAHWATAVLIAIVLYRFIQILRSNISQINESKKYFTLACCTAIVIYSSAEIYFISNAVFYSAGNSLENIQRIYIKTGLPILWGLCSFAFMWLGMHFRYRALRIISLGLFTITLLKLFIFDIRNIPAGGKIAAFFCLGVLLLVVSFMYQRLKKIIIDNEEKVD